VARHHPRRYASTQVDNLKLGASGPVPYSDVRLLPYSSTRSGSAEGRFCHAMRTACETQHFCTTTKRSQFRLICGLDWMLCRRSAREIGSGFETKTITLSCAAQTHHGFAMSSILMLRT